MIIKNGFDTLVRSPQRLLNRNDLNTYILMISITYYCIGFRKT